MYGGWTMVRMGCHIVPYILFINSSTDHIASNMLTYLRMQAVKFGDNIFFGYIKQHHIVVVTYIVIHNKNLELNEF